MENIITTKLWLWVFFLLVINVANGCWEEERNALLELQANMTSSYGGTLAIWAGYNETGFADCCSWNRVTCNLTTGRVIELGLHAVEYINFGTSHGWEFNATLFLPFKSLQVLILSNRNIIGWTKNEGFDKLSQLTYLKLLNLRDNPQLPSNVLSSLCWISSLQVLRLGDDLSYRKQTNHGDERSEICPGLSNLRELSLVGYGFDDINVLSALGLGTHPGLKILERLYLNENSFNSSIFTSLKNLPSLKLLDLSHNEIYGKIEMSGLLSFLPSKSLFGQASKN